jgi:hypothetical protein
MTTGFFWDKVNKTESCWLWSGAIHRTGYGMAFAGGRSVTAHRLSMSEHLGRPLLPSEWVLHSCDMPLCVNPAHLRIGGHSDNVRDRVERDRSHRPRGERNNNSKLDSADVYLIRMLSSMGAPRSGLASWFCISRGQVTRIGRGHSWGHL